MADTGAPWNIPYAEPTNLVRDWPALSEDVADAVAAGLTNLDEAIDGAGGLVAVKSAIFTGTQTDSVAAGDNLAVTDLTITHEVADPANRLIISAFLGAAGSSIGFGLVGIAVHDGAGLIAIGNADGARTRVSAGGQTKHSATANGVTMPSVTFVHTPGEGSKTYTVRAINIRTDTQTLFINRSQDDSNSAARPRAVSSLVIQEVKV